MNWPGPRRGDSSGSRGLPSTQLIYGIAPPTTGPPASGIGSADLANMDQVLRSCETADRCFDEAT